jgi:hypothetical protein
MEKPFGPGDPSDRRQCPHDPAAAAPFDVVVACALLTSGQLDRGLRYTVEGLAGVDAPPDDPAWSQLLELLGQSAFVAGARRPPRGDAGGPRLLDAVLGLAPASGIDALRRDWLLEHSSISRALRRRTLRIAQELERAAARAPGAPVAAFGAGHARELLLSTAGRAGRIPATLYDPDPSAVAVAARAVEGLPVAVRRASVSDVLAGAARGHACALVYLPSLADQLPFELVLDVLAAVVTWLRPGGRVVLPFFTMLPESAFLEWTTDWHPMARRAPQVSALARQAVGVATRLEYDTADGLAYLCLDLPERGSARPGP